MFKHSNKDIRTYEQLNSNAASYVRCTHFQEAPSDDTKDSIRVDTQIQLGYDSSTNLGKEYGGAVVRQLSDKLKTAITGAVTRVVMAETARIAREMQDANRLEFQHAIGSKLVTKGTDEETS